MTRFPISLSLVLILTFLTLAGCNVVSPHWIVGTWKLDEKTTESVNNEIQEAGSGPVLGKIKRLLGGAVEEFEKAFLEGSTIEFTGTEVRIMQGESGYTDAYEIIEEPGPDTVVVKKGDGTITTYHREGAKIWFKPADDLKLRIYLEPAAP